MQSRHLWITGATIATALFPAICASAQEDAPPSPPVLSAPVASGPPTVTLRYKYKAGQVVRYKMTQDISQTISGMSNAPATPMKSHVDSIMKMTVLSIRASDGAATLNTKIESMKMTMNGQPIAMPATSNTMMTTGVTTTILPNGKGMPSAQDTKSMSKALGFDPASLMSPQSGTSLPQGPVKVGDIWKATMNVMKLQIFTQSKLAAISQVNGATVADIKLYMQTNGTMVVPMQTMSIKSALKMESNGMTHFDIDAGQMISTSSDTTMTSTTTLPKNPKAPKMPTSMRSSGVIHMAIELIP